MFIGSKQKLTLISYSDKYFLYFLIGGHFTSVKGGQFPSADGVILNWSNWVSFNRIFHLYAMNNPLRFVDPNGEFLWVPVIIGAAIGAYMGGVVANDGCFNPTKWDWSSGKTWGYMLGGAIIGGGSAYLGATIAASGMPMANTAGLAASSLSNSIGMNIITSGAIPISINFGIGSYDFSSGDWGFLGEKGNKWFENMGYGLGAFANLADLGKSGELFLNTEKKDVINHSAILESDGVTPIISQGPRTNWLPTKGAAGHYFNRLIGGNFAQNSYDVKGVNMVIKGVNVASIRNYGRVLTYLCDKNLIPYSFLYSSCSTHTGLALNLAGIPTLFLHPYTVQASVWLWNIGVTPALINNSHQLNNIK